MGVSEITDDTRVIIVNKNDKEVAYLVDEVSETFKIKEEEIESVTNIVKKRRTRIFKGYRKDKWKKNFCYIRC